MNILKRITHTHTQAHTGLEGFVNTVLKESSIYGLTDVRRPVTLLPGLTDTLVQDDDFWVCLHEVLTHSTCYLQYTSQSKTQKVILTENQAESRTQR